MFSLSWDSSSVTLEKVPSTSGGWLWGVPLHFTCQALSGTPPQEARSGLSCFNQVVCLWLHKGFSCFTNKKLVFPFCFTNKAVVTLPPPPSLPAPPKRKKNKKKSTTHKTSRFPLKYPFVLPETSIACRLDARQWTCS